jgi:DNA-binding transcriptional MerR regulator
MDLQQLRYFVAVANHLNFSKAAKQLYVTQPTISHQIAVLEEQLGAKLFLRDKRSVHLTPAGEIFLKEAEKIIKSANDAVEMNNAKRHYYTISQISKILDIPADTLRYFEKKGIIKPIINKQNNYRLYDAWDVNFLVEYKYYRSMEYSMAEVIKILQFDDLVAFSNRMEERQKYFQNRKLYYTYLEENNDKQNERIRLIPEHLNKIYHDHIDDTIYFFHRKDNEYKTIAETGGLLPKWSEFFPFLNRILYISQYRLDNHINCYESGFSIASRWAEIFNIPQNSNTFHIPEGDIVCTVVRSGGKNSFKLSLFTPILDYLKQNHIPYDGNIFANLLARTNEIDGFARFLEVFIKIQN